MCNLLIEAYFNLRNNEKLLTQNFSDGNQYFIMHKKLKHYANMNIRKRNENYFTQTWTKSMES